MRLTYLTHFLGKKTLSICQIYNFLTILNLSNSVVASIVNNMSAQNRFKIFIIYINKTIQIK